MSYCHVIKSFSRGIGENRTRFQHPEWTALSYGQTTLPKMYFKNGIQRQGIQKRKENMERKKENQMGKGMGQGRRRGMEDWAEVLIYNMLIN